MSTRIEQIGKLGQSVWCDTISRSLIDSGELQRLIDAGIVGMTSNPTIFQKAITSSDDYDAAIEKLVARGDDAEAVYEHLTVTDIGDAADLLRPVYDRTDGLDGYVSLEVSPLLAHDTDKTVDEARRLFARLGRPNVFIKVPATEAGIPAVETLIGEGINVNVTLIFSLEMYAKVMEAYIRGVERLAAGGGDVGKVASVASFFVSRVDGAVDKKLQARIDAGAAELKDLLGRAAVGNAKLAYQRYKQVFHGERFAALSAKGARVQRPLWASTSTKNPSYPDTLYVDTLIGPETVNTMPLNTIEAAQDHGHVADAIERDLIVYENALTRIEAAGVSMDEITDTLLAAGVKSFSDSFEDLMADIVRKMALVRTG